MFLFVVWTLIIRFPEWVRTRSVSWPLSAQWSRCCSQDMLCVGLREPNDVVIMLGQQAGDLQPHFSYTLECRPHESYAGSPRLSFLILQWRVEDDKFQRFLQAPWRPWDDKIQDWAGGPPCSTIRTMEECGPEYCQSCLFFFFNKDATKMYFKVNSLNY